MWRDTSDPNKPLRQSWKDTPDQSRPLRPSWQGTSGQNQSLSPSWRHSPDRNQFLPSSRPDIPQSQLPCPSWGLSYITDQGDNDDKRIRGFAQWSEAVECGHHHPRPHNLWSTGINTNRPDLSFTQPGNLHKRGVVEPMWRGRGGGRPPLGSQCTSTHWSWRNTTSHADDTLFIPPVGKYEGEAPVLLLPHVLACCSTDTDFNWRQDSSMLRFINKNYMPKDDLLKVDWDLNKGWKKTKLYNKLSSDWWYNALYWILKNRDRLMAKDVVPVRLAADIICKKTTLTTIMCMPSDRKTHIIEARVFRGTIYLFHYEMHCEDEEHEMEDEEDEKEAENVDKLSLEAGIVIWGHKYPEYMTGGDPEDGVDQNKMVICYLEHQVAGMTVYSFTKLNCAADPDLYCDQFDHLSAFVAFKCCREITDSHKFEAYKRLKLIPWWVDNMLCGIPRTVVGFRNDEGTVHTLETLATDDIPKLAQGAWYPEVKINFLTNFLRFVKEKVEQQPTLVHRFIQEKSRVIRHTIHKPSSDPLPYWYRSRLFLRADTK